MLYILVATLLVVADQALKFWVRTAIPLGGSVDFIPGVLDLTYVQNTGAAFSLMAEHTWLLTMVSAVMSVVLILIILSKKVTHPLAVWSLTVILGGAVGNLVDRALFSYVTDMFRTLFMDFAVFNIADICVVLGGIAFCVYVLKFYEEPKQGGDNHGKDNTNPN